MMALVLNVPLDREFIESDRRDKVAPFPQGSLREFFCLLLYPCGGLALDQRDGIGHGVFRGNRDIQMDMLVSDVPRPDGKSLPAADHLEYPLEFLFNVRVGQHLSAVLRRPDHMVLADPGAMAQLVQSSIGHDRTTVPLVACRVR